MLDHSFLTVIDTVRSLNFYESGVPILGITNRHDFVSKALAAGN